MVLVPADRKERTKKGRRRVEKRRGKSLPNCPGRGRAVISNNSPGCSSHELKMGRRCINILLYMAKHCAGQLLCLM